MHARKLQSNLSPVALLSILPFLFPLSVICRPTTETFGQGSTAKPRTSSLNSTTGSFQIQDFQAFSPLSEIDSDDSIAFQKQNWATTGSIDQQGMITVPAGMSFQIQDSLAPESNISCTAAIKIDLNQKLSSRQIACQPDTYNATIMGDYMNLGHIDLTITTLRSVSSTCRRKKCHLHQACPQARSQLTCGLDSSSSVAAPSTASSLRTGNASFVTGQYGYSCQGIAWCLANPAGNITCQGVEMTSGVASCSSSTINTFPATIIPVASLQN